MVITNRRKFPEPLISMDGHLISVAKEMKYLGVIIDSKLSWNSHIDYIYKKCIQIQAQLLQISRLKWGLSSFAARTIYKGVIEPIILYASSSWKTALNKKTVRTKLASIQRLMALKVIRGFRTISTDAALILANLTPIDLRIREHTLIYDIKRGLQPPPDSALSVKQLSKEEWDTRWKT